MASDPAAPTPDAEDLALLDRAAARIVELHMEVPAILTLESVRPLTLVAGQAMIFFEPMVQALFRLGDYRRFTALIERRGTPPLLIERIERAAEAARSRRAANGPPA
ncbi:MAG: hypothetical protein HY076_08955 [Candidatus Eisenbacteria bacterium]|uniref:Uncharacterized protein n=1 Tax=Eiseniibacteriota bacterium TaxID=2212470 RepID=A0A9D6L7Z3_UNCEI|nr:hypothetical protein [Candidatus Eisenbacteria bacterium]MBI3540386.1 hypothetical protein [Candidatus Eisenbacteria bacterium]